MEFAKNIYDLKGKTILDMKMGQFSNEAVFVTTDGTFMIVEYEFQEDDDFERIGGNFFNKFRAEHYLLKNPGTREWLQRLKVMDENEAANYDETIKQRREKERLEREEKAIVSEKENLKRLIAKYPDLAKQAIAKEEPTC